MLLVSFFMNEFLLSTIIWINRHYVFSINHYYLFSGSHKFYFVTDMKSSIMTKCDHLNFLCQKRKPIYDFLLSTKSFAKISYLDDKVVTYQSAEDHGKNWHRFCLRLHQTVILMSNIRISASVKITDR